MTTATTLPSIRDCKATMPIHILPWEISGKIRMSGARLEPDVSVSKALAQKLDLTSRFWGSPQAPIFRDGYQIGRLICYPLPGIEPDFQEGSAIIALEDNKGFTLQLLSERKCLELAF